MIIAALATGGNEGIFYIRAEYPLAVTRVRGAIKSCYDKGILGKNINGNDFSFDVKIYDFVIPIIVSQYYDYILK